MRVVQHHEVAPLTEGIGSAGEGVASSLTAGGYTANKTSYQSVNLKIVKLILKFYSYCVICSIC